MDYNNTTCISVSEIWKDKAYANFTASHIKSHDVNQVDTLGIKNL